MYVFLNIIQICENILFGSKYDEKKYNNAIRVCALEQDLKAFIAGFSC
jgi:hypothetical protein